MTYGFQMYMLWVLVTYWEKRANFLYRLWVLTNFCCSCYGFQTFVVLKGFSLLYLLWVQLYLLWVQVICSTKKFKCIAYDCNPYFSLFFNFWSLQKFCSAIKASRVLVAGLKWTLDTVFPGWTWIFSRFETTSFKTAKSHQVHTWSFSRFKSGFANLPFFQVQIQFQIVLNLDLKQKLQNC